MFMSTVAYESSDCKHREALLELEDVLMAVLDVAERRLCLRQLLISTESKRQWISNMGE